VCGVQVDDCPDALLESAKTDNDHPASTRPDRKQNGKGRQKLNNETTHRFNRRDNQIKELEQEVTNLKMNTSSTAVSSRFQQTGNASRQQLADYIEDLKVQLSVAQQQIALLTSTPTGSTTPMPGSPPQLVGGPGQCQSPSGSTLQPAAFQQS